MSELLVAIAEAAQDNGYGVAFLIDEMQLLSPSAMEAIVAAMHDVSKRSLPLAAVGAGLPQLPRMLAEAKTYAERIFDYQQISNLDVASASDALQLPAKDAGGYFLQDALDLILEQSQRYPYFLQVYGSEVWNVAGGPKVITLDDVRLGVPLIRKDLDHGFFHVRWERATVREREYLVAMALEGDGAQTTRSIAERLGKTQGKLSVVRDRLIQKGLVCAPDHGQIDYTAPMFGDYVRRVHAPR